MYIRTLSVIALCAFLLGFSPLQASAQSDSADTETIELYVGDLLEILPIHTLPNASYAWILTENRTFVEASRQAVFRKRPITPGT